MHQIDFLLGGKGRQRAEQIEGGIMGWEKDREGQFRPRRRAGMMHSHTKVHSSPLPCSCAKDRHTISNGEETDW